MWGPTVWEKDAGIFSTYPRSCILIPGNCFQGRSKCSPSGWCGARSPHKASCPKPQLPTPVSLSHPTMLNHFLNCKRLISLSHPCLSPPLNKKYSFLGLARYSCLWVPNFSLLAKLLYNMTWWRTLHWAFRAQSQHSHPFNAPKTALTSGLLSHTPFSQRTTCFSARLQALT